MGDTSVWLMCNTLLVCALLRIFPLVSRERPRCDWVVSAVIGILFVMLGVFFDVALRFQESLKSWWAQLVLVVVHCVLIMLLRKGPGLCVSQCAAEATATD